MINVIPKPNKIKEKIGFLVLKKKIQVSSNKISRKALNVLSKLFDTEAVRDIVDVEFILGYENRMEGSYKLIIDNDVKIYANSESGFLYGVETLRQLLPIDIEKHSDFESFEVQKCIIEDYPRYEYRGFMLDVCRHYFSKEFIYKKLDEMAMLKLNKFHLHLSDDQGWRIDLPEYPKLREISSVRARTKINGGLLNNKYDVFEEKPYSGIYSLDDLRDIVDYASSLCIDVIPEIDCPGHLSALLAAYPEYSCKGKDIKVQEGPGIYKDILCMGNEEGINFMYKIIEEIAAIFPSHHVHIGGDEAPLDALKECPKCMKKMHDYGFKSVEELKLDFSNTLAKNLLDKGYKVTGWNEIVNDNYPLDAYIQLWSPTNTKKAINAVNGGHKVIDSSFFSYYLDYAYGTNPLKNSYLHNPASLFKEDACLNVLGVESPLWTEWVRDENRADWQMYPRLLATAETAWTENKNKNYNDFLNRVSLFDERLDLLGVNHTTKNCYLSKKRIGRLSLLLSKEIVSTSEYNKYNKK